MSEEEAGAEEAPSASGASSPMQDSPVEDSPVEDSVGGENPDGDLPTPDLDELFEELGAHSLLDETAVLTAERDEYLDALRRLQADFDNFRKRTTRLQAEAQERAAESVVQKLLPVLDALDLALAHVGERDGSGGGTSELESAFVQIGNLLRDVLAKEGLERVDEVGVSFDPTIHDAVAHESAADGEQSEAGEDSSADGGPVVVESMRAGYRLKGRVLRPAMVKVRA